MAAIGNIARIANALKERRSVKSAIKKISNDSEKERSDEEVVNSFISSIQNVFAIVQTQADVKFNDKLDGMIIEPKNVTPNIIGTIQDPRLLIEMAQRDEKFNRLYEVIKRNNDIGKEQYVIRERKMNI